MWVALLFLSLLFLLIPLWEEAVELKQQNILSENTHTHTHCTVLQQTKTHILQLLYDYRYYIITYYLNAVSLYTHT